MVGSSTRCARVARLCRIEAHGASARKSSNARRLLCPCDRRLAEQRATDGAAVYPSLDRLWSARSTAHAAVSPRALLRDTFAAVATVA
eukprot:1244046-Prymnesium_polylepis.1